MTAVRNFKWQVLFSIFLFSIMFLFTFFSSSVLSVYALDNIAGQTAEVSLPYTNSTINLTSFVIKSDKEFYFTNGVENKIVVWKEGVIEEFGEFGGSPENFVTPSLISTLPNGDIYVYDSLRRLKQFHSNYSFEANYNMVYSDTTYISMGRLSSITNDLKNNLYALDYENNIIIKKSPTSNELVELLSGAHLGFTLTQDSQIVVSPNGEVIYLANINGGNNIYSIENLTSLNQVDLISASITTVYQIAIDCANNLFVLEKDALNSKLHKLARNTYEEESILTLPLNELNNVLQFNINIETGEILFLNESTNTLNNITYPTYLGTFTQDILSFTHPVNYVEETPLTTLATLATVAVNNAPLLQTPYNITPLVLLPEHTAVILLTQTVIDNPDYSYVIYVNNQSLENVSGYVLSENLQVITQVNASNEVVKVLNNDTNLYKYPTSLITNDALITVGTINKNEELPVVRSIEEITDANGQTFFAVSINTNEIAYVRSMDVVFSSLPIIMPTLYTNAEIFITDDSTEVFVYADYEDAQTLLPDTLEDGKRIYLSSYNGAEEYTQVTFLNSNDEEVTGYIQTKYIKLYGDYNNLLQAFLLSLISFVLIVILILVKTKKKIED